MRSNIKTSVLFSERIGTIEEEIYKYEYPWQAIPHIEEIIISIAKMLDISEYHTPKNGVWISKHAAVAPSAYINGPAIIMPGAEVRHGAFIRTAALIGSFAVVGNSTEIKNAILMERAAAPHFNYVGDSILGYKAHIGAGVICSNLRLDKAEISIRTESEPIRTGLRKLGAIIGDCAEIGSGSVLNPGTVILPYGKVYPLSSVQGVVQ